MLVLQLNITSSIRHEFDVDIQKYMILVENEDGGRTTFEMTPILVESSETEYRGMQTLGFRGEIDVAHLANYSTLTAAVTYTCTCSPSGIQYNITSEPSDFDYFTEFRGDPSHFFAHVLY